MRVDDIGGIIDSLLEKDHLNAVLVSGSWGIGKTYNIKKYIEKNKEKLKEDKCKIAYTSLFGKLTLDEVNTELYNIFHPKAKILHTISNVVKLVGVGAEVFGLPISIDADVEFNKNLKGKKKEDQSEDTKQDENLKIKKKKTKLVIIDDFERKNPNISAEDLLGYINNLINQGFKVLVLADLSAEHGKINKCYEIGKEGDEKSKQYIAKINWNNDILGTYKEKIFDRIYEITETPEQVINSILKSNKQYVSNKVIKEFNNNLRMVIKTKVLFEEVYAAIKKAKIESIDLNVLFEVCTYVIIGSFTTKYKEYFEEQKKVKEYLKFTEDTFARYIITYNKNLENYYNLINAIYNIYTENDWNLFVNTFLKEDQATMFDSLFYLSDSDKIKMAKKQYNYVLNLTKDSLISNSYVNQFIKEWFCYCGFLDLSFINKQKLFKKLHELNFEIDLFGERNQRYISFIEEYQKYSKNQRKYDMGNLLNSDDPAKIKDCLYLISHSLIEEDEKQYLIELFKHNNFYLKNITGNISQKDWEFNHLICSCVNGSLKECKTDLFNYLNTIKDENKNDLSCKYRVESLIEQYKLNIKNKEND